MKIELEEPFKSKWKHGYLVINPENRRNVCLVNSKYERTTISYARYLMSVQLGMFLDDDVHVDHIDDDKTNDSIDNLQLLTPEMNRSKETDCIRKTVVTYHNCHCNYCKKEFTITNRYFKMKLAASIANIFCTRECFQLAMKDENSDIRKRIFEEQKESISNRVYNGNRKDQSVIDKIKRLREEGHIARVIAERLGINRNTVMKYW